MTDIKFIVAQTIGIIALCCAITSFQQKEHKKIMLFQVIASTLFAIHFFMLEAYTGSVLNLLSLIRSGIYFFKDKKWASHPVWPYIFCLLFTLSTIFTWEGIISILPLTGCIVTTLSFNLKSPKLVRIFSSPSSVCWIIYNFISASWAGIITELFNLGSIVVGYMRLDRKKS